MQSDKVDTEKSNSAGDDTVGVQNGANNMLSKDNHREEYQSKASPEAISREQAEKTHNLASLYRKKKNLS